MRVHRGGWRDPLGRRYQRCNKRLKQTEKAGLVAINPVPQKINTGWPGLQDQNWSFKPHRHSSNRRLFYHRDMREI